MNTLYITGSGRIMLDENNNPSSVERSRTSIDDVYYIKEDTKVVFNRGEYKTEVEAKAGNIVVVFYEKEFPNRVIVVDSEPWRENLEAYEAWEQKQKEEWAAKKADDCPACDNCESCPW